MPVLEWREQLNLLGRSKQSGVHLAQILRDAGLSYDDLRYEVDREDDLPALPLLRDMGARKRKSRGIPLVSFFSGCGGMDLGFEAAGYDSLACVDNNRLFCDTLRLNRPEWTVIGPPDHAGDVSDREGLAERLGKIIGRDFEGVFIGGPPCQPFSIAANQRFSKSGPNFKRIGFAHSTNGGLLSDYLWQIRRFRPKGFVIENVEGLRSMDGGSRLKNAVAEMRRAGYSCSVKLLDASDYGVPQRRSRLFIVGSLQGDFLFPQPAQDKIGCFRALNRPTEGVKNHVTREHEAGSVERYALLRYGQRDSLGRVDRLDPLLPAKTVIAGGLAGGGRSHLHPSIPRTLSVRECARLQTFPDDFEFQGRTGRQFTQVGNAVPPLLAFHLARSMADQFFA